MSGTFGSRLREARKAKQLTQKELAVQVGAKHNSVSNWENDLNKPDPDTIELLCEVLEVSADYLLPSRRAKAAETNQINANDLAERYPGLIPISQLKLRRVPVIGEIAAGVPITANREYDEYIEVPDTADARKYDLSLRVKGDSMKPRYLDGDLVFIRCQPDVRDGQIAAVVVGGEATLKRVYHVPGGVQLISENPEYSPMLYTEDDVNDIHLIGLAVGFMRWETQR